MTTEYVMAMPSLGRAKIMTGMDLLEGLPCKKFIFVDNTKERRAYRRVVGKRAEVIDVHATSPWGPSHIHNRILDYFNNDTHLLTVVDDLKGVYTLDGSKKNGLRKLTVEEISRVIVRGFADCRKVKTKLWGVVAVKNSFYMKNTVSSRVFINDGFCGVIVGNLRWDEDQRLKSDYDYGIQHVVEYGCVVRYNSICLDAPYQSSMEGGATSYRTQEMERESIDRLKDKWPHFVHDNPRRVNEILLRFQRGAKRMVKKRKIKRGC